MLREHQINNHSIHDIAAPQEKPISGDASIEWVEIVDPSQALYPRRLPMVSVSRGPQLSAMVQLSLEDGSVVKVPLRATSLSTLVRDTPRAKLSTDAVREFHDLVKEYKIVSTRNEVQADRVWQSLGKPTEQEVVNDLHRIFKEMIDENFRISPSTPPRSPCQDIHPTVQSQSSATQSRKPKDAVRLA